MKLFKFSVTAAIVWLSALSLGSCSEDQGIDNRDMDYGYVQFKLYKNGSFESATASEGTRATKPELDYLSEATKVNITLLYGETTISQTLTLSAASHELAEYGLRSEKLKLLTGSYKIVTFVLYDANDEPIYNGYASEDTFDVIQGGLTPYDLSVNTAARGKVRFSFTKDLSGFDEVPSKTRSAARQYTFEEIRYVDITVRRTGDNLLKTFTNLKTKFSIHFPDKDEDGNNENGEPSGYQTSTLTCDSLLTIEGGEWTVRGYKTYGNGKLLLEEKSGMTGSAFTVEDNRTAKPKIGITLNEADEYIQDYYALYEIWKALDGPNWYYRGQNFPLGTNWNFNRDPDLWGRQPGVELHSNGRVARIAINDFGFGGKIPEQIGQLTELMQLQLGTHNDYGMIPDDPTLDRNQSLAELSRNRIKNHQAYLRYIHPATQFSEPMAFGFKEQNITTPHAVLYDQKYTEKDLFEPGTGRQYQIRPMDNSHGTLSNRLESIDEAIGNLRKLEYFYLANSPIEKLPDALEQLESCADLEIYNCPNMKKFPMVITRMPALVAVNIANNRQWGTISEGQNSEIYKGLDALANGPSKEKIQILYCRDTKLEKVPASYTNFKNITLIDLAQNELTELPALGKEIKPYTIHLDYNKIEKINVDANGLFCGLDNLETFSATNNKLKKVPDIFTRQTLAVMETADFSINDIDGFENDGNGYKGLNSATLGLANNPRLGKYPTALAKSNSNISSIILRGCNIDEIPEGSFTGKYSYLMTSIDLSFNKLTKLPKEWSAQNLPYVTGVDLSYNSFSEFPWQPLNTAELVVFMVRGQRDAEGRRCLRQWPEGLYNHKGLRGFFIGSNDLRQVTETISFLIYRLDISDNPNIIFDAKDICYYWRNGAYEFIYDKTQDIRNCDYMLK